ncbi:MAG: HgcAB-associated protein [Candidatus Bathyarchaeota archaeon]|nr:HgcAB-associated protein [Candidatus Bathyarchaeota archaeon]
MPSEKCCKIEAIVTVDAKGQIILPKDLREKAKLAPNDKLAVIGCECRGEIGCFVIVKAETLDSQVKNLLGPILQEAFHGVEEK